MIVYKGKHSGFCFGVSRAVEQAEKLKGEDNYILGEIIHNESVTEKLKKSGVKVIDNLDEVNFNGGETLLIRTHGEPKETFDKAKKYNLNVIDCTCPFVREIQKIVEKHYTDGYKIAIIGKAGHPEIEGINGWCENTALITESVEELSSVEADKLCIVVQTTYAEEKFNKIIKKDYFHRFFNQCIVVFFLVYSVALRYCIGIFCV